MRLDWNIYRKTHCTKCGNFKEPLAIQREMDFYTAEEFRQYIDIAKQQAEEKQTKEENLYE